jgi:hypothetical protein
LRNRIIFLQNRIIFVRPRLRNTVFNHLDLCTDF